MPYVFHSVMQYKAASGTLWPVILTYHTHVERPLHSVTTAIDMTIPSSMTARYIFPAVTVTAQESPQSVRTACRGQSPLNSLIRRNCVEPEGWMPTGGGGGGGLIRYAALMLGI